ncbi:MAG TPA: hypothetical protein VMV77_06425 [Bacteroidales bacterium]|nr:hypothetical protein [Bacteroidales bacterium]
MELNIKERLGIIQMLPSNGDYDEMELAESVNDKVNIFREEQIEIAFYIDPQGFPAWKTDKTVEVPLTKKETDFIKERIRVLHERGHITQFMFKAVKRFGRPVEKSEKK